MVVLFRSIIPCFMLEYNLYKFIPHGKKMQCDTITTLQKLCVFVTFLAESFVI